MWQGRPGLAARAEEDELLAHHVAPEAGEEGARGRGRRLTARQDQSEAGEDARGARTHAPGGHSAETEARQAEKTAKIAPASHLQHNFVRFRPCVPQWDMVTLWRFHDGMASAGVGAEVLSRRGCARERVHNPTQLGKL